MNMLTYIVAISLITFPVFLLLFIQLHDKEPLEVKIVAAFFLTVATCTVAIGLRLLWFL